MAGIDLIIAGRRHELACRDGEEAHLRTIAAMVDTKATDAARTMGGMSEARQMLFAALMLADELDEARTAAARLVASAPAAAPEPDPAIAVRVARLVERVERLAALIDASARVETPASNA